MIGGSIDVLQQLLWDWGWRCFGEAHMNNKVERTLRLSEEVFELAQCLDVPKHQLHTLIDYVYDRPPGTISQELGGVSVTFLILLKCLGAGIGQITLSEAQRVLAKDPGHFRQRNQEKTKAGFGHAPPKIS